MTNQASKIKKNIGRVFLYLGLILLAIFFLFPFMYMFFKSVMGNYESIGQPEVRFLPTEWHFENYAAVFDSTFLRYFLNTMLVIVFNVFGTTISACLCGYGFGRGRFKSKSFWFIVMLSTIMLPSAVTQVPLYLLFSRMGLTGTIAPLIIPCFFGGGALNIFLANQFVRGITKEMDEAAVIDGASRMRIFFQIILPLLKPLVIYIVVNTVMNCWRDFDSALIYIGNTASAQKWQTLALGIYYKFLISGSENGYPNMQMATGVVMVIPIAILFLIFQKQLVEGVVMTGIKG